MKVKKLAVVEVEVEHTDIEPVRPAPDGYRGDMSCLKVVHPYTTGERVDMFDPLDSVYEVLDPAGQVIGYIRHIYGNNGHGKLAASKYYPKAAS